MLTAYTGLQSGDVDTFRKYWPLPENQLTRSMQILYVASLSQ